MRARKGTPASSKRNSRLLNRSDLYLLTLVRSWRLCCLRSPLVVLCFASPASLLYMSGRYDVA
jgi:hypothetical protein